MVIDTAYLKAIQGLSGCSSVKESKVLQTRDRFARDFNSSINVVFDATRNEQKQDFIIARNQKKWTITPRPGESVTVGDIIEYNNIRWLVTERNPLDEIYKSAIIERCNKVIRWQNPVTYEIVERWCLCTKPTANIDEGKVLSTSSREFQVKLPFDEETSLIDLGKRFMLEKINGKPRTYSVTCVDSLTSRFEGAEKDEGLLIWNITQDEAGRENDNLVFEVCDYADPPQTIIPSPPPISGLKITIDGSPVIKVGGHPAKYQAHFYQPDGVTEDFSITANWDGRLPDGHEMYYTVQTNGNSIYISAHETEEVIGDVLTVAVVDSNRKYEMQTYKIQVVI